MKKVTTSVSRSMIGIGLLCGSLAPLSAQALSFQTIDFLASGLANVKLTTLNAPASFPYSTPGNPTSFNGVPFIVENSTSNNAWSASFAPNGNTAADVSQTFPMSVSNIYGFYTLASLWWGTPNAAVTDFTFNFSDASSYTRTLTNNIDLRDYNIPSGWSNSINGTTTVNVFSDPNPLSPGHTWNLDRQYIELPGAYQGKDLVSFTVTDRGGDQDSRIFLTAATAQVGASGQVGVPEPSSFALMGIAGVFFMLKRRQA